MREEWLNHPSTILNHRTSSTSSLILGIHMVVLFIVFLFLVFYPIETRLEFVGYYEEGYILMTVDDSFFEISSNVVKIGDDSYSYQVKEIKPIAYEEGKISLWQIQVEIDLKDVWRINNHQFRLSFFKEKKTAMKRILSMITRGGIYERIK